MTGIDKEFLEKWIEKADHDLIATKIIIDTHPIILDIACFHCQQAVEKFLKAFLLFQEQELKKIHNLNVLLKDCLAFDIDFKLIDIKNLNLYAVQARYPEYIASNYTTQGIKILSNRFTDQRVGFT